MNMNYQINRTYFKPKKALAYVGGAFCVLAAPLYIFLHPILGIIALLIGVFSILINRELNVRRSDVEEQIKAETDRLAAALEDKYFDVKNPDPKMTVTVVGDYVTEGEGLIVRREALGSGVTSRYAAAAVGIRHERLYFMEERFSIVEDGDVTSSDGEYPFTDLDRVEYGPAEGAAIPHVEFALIDRNGKELFRVPAKSDYPTQKFVEDLNVYFERARAAGTNKE